MQFTYQKSARNRLEAENYLLNSRKISYWQIKSFFEQYRSIIAQKYFSQWIVLCNYYFHCKLGQRSKWIVTVAKSSVTCEVAILYQSFTCLRTSNFKFILVVLALQHREIFVTGHSSWLLDKRSLRNIRYQKSDYMLILTITGDMNKPSWRPSQTQYKTVKLDLNGSVNGSLRKHTSINKSYVITCVPIRKEFCYGTFRSINQQAYYPISYVTRHLRSVTQ